MENFDYSHITYFGDYSLNGLVSDHIWLNKEVDYVGEESFGTSFIYVEYGVDYSKWANGAGLNKISVEHYYDLGAVANCLKNDEMIYSINPDDTVTGYRWLKSDKEVTVPNAIDGKKLTQLGYGFLSQFGEITSIKDSDDYSNALNKYTKAVLPSSLVTIEKGAIDLYGALIYIPSTISNVYAYTNTFDDKIHSTSYLAFESSTLPSFFKKELGDLTSEDWENGIGSSVRYGKGLLLDNIKYDSNAKTFYYTQEDSVSILSCMDSDASMLEIPKSFDNKPIRTIMTNAYRYLGNLIQVRIGNSVTRIQKMAFSDIDLRYVFIPKNVAVISKYGFDDCVENFYIEHASIPDDWDSYWYWSSTSSSTKTHYSVDVTNMATYHEDGYWFWLFGNEVTLFSYDIQSANLVLPSKLHNCPVTAIASGFDEETGGKDIYIPKTIVSADINSFNTSRGKLSSYTYFYFEGSEIPDGFLNNWAGNSSYYYTNYYYNQSLPLTIDGCDFAFTLKDNKITLISYLGTSKDIYLPRNINGYPITGVAQGLVYSNEGKNVYIPTELSRVIASRTFLAGTDEEWNFYFEKSSGTTGYSSTTSSNVKSHYNCIFDY